MKELLQKAVEQGLSSSQIDNLIKLREFMQDETDDSLIVMATYHQSLPYQLTDLGNAHRLADLCEDQAFWCDSKNRWLIYDGIRWTSDRPLEIQGFAEKVIKNLLNEQYPDCKELMTWYKRSQSSGRIKAMIEHSKPLLLANIEEFDANPWLFNVLNGTIDLKTGELLQHSPRDKITKLCPVEFDREARCPNFETFINQIMSGDQERIEFLKRWFGYCLTGVTHEQIFCIFHGIGANGKSTLIETIGNLMDDYAVAAESKTFSSKSGNGIPTDIARLKGARFVSAVEVNDGKSFDEALVKKLTGNDKITARFLYGNEFEFAPTFKIVIAANHLPEHSGNYSITRRLKVIPFNEVIPANQMNRNLLEQLNSELPGILNWLISGCLDWQQNGLNSSTSIDEASKEYRKNCNQVVRFINERCQKVAAAKTPKRALYEIYYCEWAKRSGEKVLSEQAFNANLIELGLKENRNAKGKFWYDITPINESTMYSQMY